MENKREMFSEVHVLEPLKQDFKYLLPKMKFNFLLWDKVSYNKILTLKIGQLLQRLNSKACWNLQLCFLFKTEALLKQRYKLS